MDEFFIYADLFDGDMYHLMMHTLRFHNTPLKYHIASIHRDHISDLVSEPDRSSIFGLKSGEMIKIKIDIREA